MKILELHMLPGSASPREIMVTCAHYVKERVLEVDALSGSMTFETADGAVTFEFSVEEGHALTQDDGERLVLGHRAWER